MTLEEAKSSLPPAEPEESADEERAARKAARSAWLAAVNELRERIYRENGVTFDSVKELRRHRRLPLNRG
jgi:hypothetical protein